MKTLLELQPLIIEWAREKGLVDESIAPKQRLKLVEEAGERQKQYYTTIYQKQRTV